MLKLVERKCCNLAAMLSRVVSHHAGSFQRCLVQGASMISGFACLVRSRAAKTSVSQTFVTCTSRTGLLQQTMPRHSWQHACEHSSPPLQHWVHKGALDSGTPSACRRTFQGGPSTQVMCLYEEDHEVGVPAAEMLNLSPSASVM